MAMLACSERLFAGKRRRKDMLFVNGQRCLNQNWKIASILFRRSWILTINCGSLNGYPQSMGFKQAARLHESVIEKGKEVGWASARVRSEL
mmetsp:Transcript_61304/g.134302  ORF Transcript_61304/g.134302 Transcript_61304/m.134302 type:complete len:91 (+) Transcript_61304:738-1010(+)